MHNLPGNTLRLRQVLKCSYFLNYLVSNPYIKNVSCCSCQPCMHSFCAGCYSDWMERSTECPSVCNFPLLPTTRCNIFFDRVLLFFSVSAESEVRTQESYSQQSG